MHIFIYEVFANNIYNIKRKCSYMHIYIYLWYLQIISKA